MKIVSKLWLQMDYLFDIVQIFFNGNFWEVFTKRYSKFNNKKVIDLACGTGELRNHLSPKQYLGIDINASYIKYSKKRYKNYQKTSFIREDITKATFPQSDVCFLVSAIHHLTDSQVKALCKNLQKQNVKQFIVIDGIPQGYFSQILKFLDASLGGGKYFRDEKEIARLLSFYFMIKIKGRFSAKNSFYFYPYVEALPLRHKRKVH